MNYKGHLLVGWVTGLLFFSFLMLSRYTMDSFFSYGNLYNITILSAVITVYSLFPDIDIKTSKIYNAFLFLALAGIIGCFIFEMKIIGIVLALVLGCVSMLTHRKSTHTILAGILLSALLYPLGDVLVVVGFACYLSHLIVDKEVEVW